MYKIYYQMHLASKKVVHALWVCMHLFCNTQIKVVPYLPLRSCMFVGYELLLRSKLQLVRQSTYPYSILQGSVNKHGA